MIFTTQQSQKVQAATTVTRSPFLKNLHAAARMHLQDTTKVKLTERMPD
jgi:hypothetical protein